LLESAVGREIDCFFCELPFVADQVPFGHQDRYLLRRLLRPGGMGYVFDTFDTALRKRVALKIPLVLASADDAHSHHARERFRNEIRALTYLNHPNINSIADHSEWQDRLFFTMPYLIGGTLAQRLARPSRPEIDQVAGWVLAIARAMEYAHQIGVYHRDLKPANLMFDTEAEGARLMVTDFGLALIHGDTRITQDGTRLGTPAYMSPEQMAGRPQRHGAKSDIYSLGVIFFEALTGRLPFRETGEALRALVLKDDPPRPSTIRPEIPERLEAICLKAMARSVRLRYRSMGELAREIERYLGRDNDADLKPVQVDDIRTGPHLIQHSRHQVALSRVPAGEFFMGSTDSEDERPPRRVKLESSYYIGVYPVTQGLYRAVVGELPLSRFSGNERDRHPVDSVSWYDAINFCNRLSLSADLPPFYEIRRSGDVRPKGGSGYRLPTEAEWEYACRAGSSSAYFFGDDAGRLPDFAWFEANSQMSTQPVGGKIANGYSLHDMIGNVWEWCWDWYGPYASRAAGDAELLIDPAGPKRGTERILRGGCFQASAHQLRSSQRNGFDPELGVHYIGFRVVRSLGS
jgi:formylglycine-generating enzyme required for sulfatase activity